MAWVPLESNPEVNIHARDRYSPISNAPTNFYLFSVPGYDQGKESIVRYAYVQ